MPAQAAPDVGFFLDHGTWRNTSGTPNTPSWSTENFTTRMEYIVRMQNVSVGGPFELGALSPACAARYPTRPGLCFLAPRMAFSLDTPTFMFNRHGGGRGGRSGRSRRSGRSGWSGSVGRG